MYPEIDLGMNAWGVAPFYPYNAAYFFYPFGVALFYPHRTPTLGFMATFQPASRDISSRKHTAGRFSIISVDCRIRAHLLQPLTAPDKPVPVAGTQLSRSTTQPSKDTVPPSSQPLQSFPDDASNRLVPTSVPPLPRPSPCKRSRGRVLWDTSSHERTAWLEGAAVQLRVWIECEGT
nr:hypothetical protein HmN_000612500 [Hymenolepis microstoma]